METTFYHDDAHSASNNALLKKNMMTLDLSSGARGTKRKMTSLLASPDMSMLGLASPELERMIIAQSGTVNTTPTPTQFVFPRSVTEEQEAYARGFVDALEKLHKDEDSDGTVTVSAPATGVLGVNLVNVPVTATSNQVSVASTVTATAVPQQQPLTTVLPVSTFTTTTSLPGSILQTSTPATTVLQPQQITTVVQELPTKSESSRLHPLNNVATTGTHLSYQTVSPKPAAAVPSTVIDVALKEEPQTVPCVIDNPDLAPIDMEEQEVVKLDRKRARNRVAARKCRQRKLERISRLEERVDELKGQNSELSNTAQTLREQVMKLKKQIMEHVESGCQVMLAPNMV